MPTTVAPRFRALPIAVIVVGLAAVLRFWAIGSGAPYRVGVDEPFVVATAVGIMKSGDFNPHFFDYGGLTIYLHVIAASVRFLVGASSGQWASLDDVWDGDFIVAGRILTAIFGTLTVVVIYCAGRRWGPAVAVLAAAVVAVHQQHVRESHFALTDVPLTFWIALALLLALRAGERADFKSFLLAGAAVGAAAATKYNGSLAIILPFTAAMLVPRRLPMLLATVAGAAAAFLIGAPYSLLDLPGFLNGFASLMQHYNHPASVAAAATVYVKYLRNWFTWQGVLPLEIGWIGVAIALGGVIAVVRYLFSPGSRRPAFVLLLFPFTYFWFISEQGALQYGRYLMPVVPMLALFFAIGVAFLAERLEARSRIAWLIAVVVLLPSLAASIAWNRDSSRVATAEQAGAWIVANVPEGARIVVEGQAVRLPPRYRVVEVTRLIDRTADEYRDDRVDYLVASATLSDRLASRPEELSVYQTLLQNTALVHAFPQTPDHPGPTITVLEVPRTAP